jgi:hypothetical protein
LLVNKRTCFNKSVNGLLQRKAHQYHAKRKTAG